jgi:hypothetical protein
MHREESYHKDTKRSQMVQNSESRYQNAEVGAKGRDGEIEGSSGGQGRIQKSESRRQSAEARTERDRGIKRSRGERREARSERREARGE